MDERQLHAFLTILESGSLSQAAERLGMAQPSLSQMLLRLEDELGARLFERTSRGVLPTAAAMQLQTSAYSIINEFRDVRERVAAKESSRGGPVRFGAPTSISGLFREAFLAQLSKTVPLELIEIRDGTTDDVKRWLEDEIIDFGIMYNVEGMKSAVLHPTAVEQLVLISRRDADVGVDALGMDEVGIDLREEMPPLVLFSVSNGMRRFITSTCSRAGIEVNPTYVSDSLSVVKSMVRHGVAAAILPHACVGEDLLRGDISGREILYPAMDRVVFIARKFAVEPNSMTARVERAVRDSMHWMAGNGHWRASPMELG